MTKNAVLDTNIFLHYNIKDVNWCKEMDAAAVELMVSFTVIRELEEKKQDRNDRILAERARNNLLLIRDLNGKSDGIRTNVKITILGAEPKVDWDRLNLDRTINDDRIIASILERDNTKEDVLVTDDIGLQLKAKMNDIKFVELQANKIPEPKSDAEIELEKTRNQLQKYENRTPKLSLFLHSQEQEENKPPKFFLKKPQLMTQADIERIVEERRKQYNRNTGSSQGSLDPFRFPDMQAHIDLMNYLRQYRDYLNKKNEIEQLKCSTIPIKFDICSQGTAPAEGVGCYIEFPEGFEIIEEAELQERLKQPEEPTMTQSNAFFTTREVIHSIDSLGSQYAGSRTMSIDVDWNRIDVRVESISHNHWRTVEDLFAKLPDPELRNFVIKYEIHASNLPFPIIDKKIPVLLER